MSLHASRVRMAAAKNAQDVVLVVRQAGVGLQEFLPRLHDSGGRDPHAQEDFLLAARRTRSAASVHGRPPQPWRRTIVVITTIVKTNRSGPHGAPSGPIRGALVSRFGAARRSHKRSRRNRKPTTNRAVLSWPRMRDPVVREFLLALLEDPHPPPCGRAGHLWSLDARGAAPSRLSPQSGNVVSDAGANGEARMAARDGAQTFQGGSGVPPDASWS